MTRRARRLAQEAVSAAVRWSGASYLVRMTIARGRASILLYHDPSAETLDRHLAYLATRYSFVSLSTLVDAIRERRWSSLPPRPLVVTFDDGHRRNALLAGTLERHGVVPTIYACSEIVGTSRHYWFLETQDPEPLKPLANAERLRLLERHTGYLPAREYPGNRQALSRGEVAELCGIVEFGAHTRFHPVLTTCDDAECEREIARSKVEIEGLVGGVCRHFSYPNGDHGEREIDHVRRAGYASARSTDVGWNGPATDPYRLKILGTSDDASVNRLATDLTGISGFVARARMGRFDGSHRPVARS